MKGKICVICKERIEEAPYLELHLVDGVASVLYHEKCYISITHLTMRAADFAEGSALIDRAVENLASANGIPADKLASR
jgi:hypothetical protein